MGRPIVEKLSTNNNIYVTTRRERVPMKNIVYIKGDATQIDFLEKIIVLKSWDVIIDFMVHTESNLKKIIYKILDSTRQYVFISSARVYSQSDEPIKENTPRLLDVSTDKEYLSTNEYALAKAREENLLFNSGRKNFTIIRPSVTYNTYRLQLGVLEKENWLYRALKGRSIVFSEDLNDKITTMTLGDDVSNGIASIIGQEKALGETFHITSPISLPWSEVLATYLKVLKKHTGKDIPVVMTPKTTNLKFKRRVYQVIYCRYFNRTFDNSKIAQFCDINSFAKPKEGLAKCLEEFLAAPQFGNIQWDLEAINDKAVGEYTPLNEIQGYENKVTYYCHRNGIAFLIKPTKLLLRTLRIFKK